MFRDLFDTGEPSAYRDFLISRREKLTQARGNSPDEPHYDHATEVYADPNFPTHVHVVYERVQYGPLFVHSDTLNPDENPNGRTVNLHVINGDRPEKWVTLEFDVSSVVAIPSTPVDLQAPVRE